MDLRCGNRHLWGQKIDVRGKIYDISPGGLVEDVSTEHAQLLMQSAAWTSADDAAPPTLQPPAGDRRSKLLALGAPALIRVARDLGISVMGKSPLDAALAIIAREDELAAARAKEDEERAAKAQAEAEAAAKDQEPEGATDNASQSQDAQGE